MDFSEFDQFVECRPLNEDRYHPVILLRHKLSGAYYVQKEVSKTMLPLYSVLKKRARRMHSGIPEIYGLIEMGDCLFVIEQYIKGKTLALLIQEQSLSQEEGINIFLRLCEILKICHEEDPVIIHRDIKPSNVMLSDEGEVFLIDFGASRLYKEDVQSDTICLGTTGHAAPEQYGFHQSDCRSDIFSLGILLNMLLTGEHPDVLLAGVPYDRIIQKCTQIEPEDRYCNIRRLELALKDAVRSSQRKRIFQKPDEVFSQWLPPGFRTGRLWKMAAASLGYLLIIWTAFSSNTDEKPAPIPAKCIFLLGMMAMVFLLFNYRDIYRRLPLLRHRKLWMRMVALLFYEGLILFVTVLLMGAVSFLPGI